MSDKVFRQPVVAADQIYEFSLSRKRVKTGVTIEAEPKAIGEYVAGKLRERDQEVSLLVMVDHDGEIIGTVELATGTAETVTGRVSEIVRPAVMLNATNIIIAHNHPRATSKPSDNDRRLTLEVAKACDTLDIELIDSIVVGKDGDWFSMREDDMKNHGGAIGGLDINGHDLGGIIGDDVLKRLFGEMGVVVPDTRSMAKKSIAKIGDEKEAIRAGLAALGANEQDIESYFAGETGIIELGTRLMKGKSPGASIDALEAMGAVDKETADKMRAAFEARMPKPINDLPA